MSSILSPPQRSRSTDLPRGTLRSKRRATEMVTSKSGAFRPGHTVPQSGIWGQYQGGRLRNEVTSVQGEPFPPGQKPGTTYKPIRFTR